MAHPGKLAFKASLIAVGVVLAVAGASAQESGATSGVGAEALAEGLVDGLPCSATQTPDALEGRLDESLESLVDLAGALEIVANDDEQCAEVRAAAARQRLYITQAGFPEADNDGMARIGTPLAFAFEVGPPPLNMLRGRRATR